MFIGGCSYWDLCGCKLKSGLTHVKLVAKIDHSVHSKIVMVICKPCFVSTQNKFTSQTGCSRNATYFTPGCNGAILVS